MRPLVAPSGAAPARRLPQRVLGHDAQIVQSFSHELEVGARNISSGPLVPHHRLLVVRCVEAKPSPKHACEIILADGVAPLGADLVRRQRPLVVDRNALAEGVDTADASSSVDVALRERCRTNE